jgi:hypothetical protein
VPAHRAPADRSAAGALALPRLRPRRVDDDEMDRGVVATRPAQDAAPHPAGGERPHDDDAVGALQGAPDRRPMPRMHQGSPQRVRKVRQPHRPQLTQAVAVERTRLERDQRRLAGTGEAGHDHDVVRVRREEHAPKRWLRPFRAA